MDAVRGIRAVAAPVVAGGGRLRALQHDLDAFLRRGAPTLDPAGVVAGTIAEIDWTAPAVVLWLPGTNMPGVPDGVRDLLAARGLRAANMPYMASWQLATSIADGERTFRLLLEEVARRRRPGQRVIVLGESQGAWIASNVLLDPAYAAMVDRTALIAHPGIAPNHAPGTTGGPESLSDAVHEFNNPEDVTTHWLGDTGANAISVIEAASRLELGVALLGAARIALTDRAAVAVLLGSQKFRTTGGASPHAAGSPYDAALAWALATTEPRRPKS